MRGYSCLVPLAMALAGTFAPTQLDAGCQCPSGTQLVSETVYVPFSLLNADAGDAIVHQGRPGGNIGDIPGIVLRALGMTHTHAALVTADGPDGYAQEITEFDVRSNIEPEPSNRDARLDSHWLAHLPPGFRRWDFDTYLTRRGFNLQTAKVLRARNRAAAEAVASYAQGLGGSYRMQEFSNLRYFDHDEGGTTCSGFVWWAWAKSGRGYIPPAHYSEAIRVAGGHVIYDNVYSIALTRIPFPFDQSDETKAWVARRVANQVVNCFLDRGCGNTDSDWDTYPGVGLTAGPDDLLPRAGNTAYASVHRMQTSGGRWAERGRCVRPDGTSSPAVCHDDNPPPGGGELPSVEVETPPPPDPTGSWGANIPIFYTLHDPEGDLLSLSVEFSQDGDTWSRAKPGPGGDGMRALSVGVRHRFVWDSMADGVGFNNSFPHVRIRMTPFDSQQGTPGVTDEFVVDNTQYDPPCTPPPDEHDNPIYCGDHECSALYCENRFNCQADCGSCGDNICGGTETQQNCSQDCGRCGDLICSGPETVSNCPADCNTCGDGACRPETGETFETCPSDCNTCGDLVCAGSETPDSCPTDCPQDLQ
jgi:hypothetical protein